MNRLERSIRGMHDGERLGEKAKPGGKMTC